MSGIGVMAAGGLCIATEEAVWALALFFAGILFALSGIVMIAVSIPLERKYSKARSMRGRAISENSFIVGRTILTFLDEGMYISKSGREEPFEEGRIIVPYSAIKAYHTTRRRRPSLYGQEITYVKMPAYFLKEGRSGNVAYCLEANKKFVRMLDRYGADVRDTRSEPSARPKYKKTFLLSSYKRKRSISSFFFWGAIVFVALATVGIWVTFSRSVAAGIVIAVAGFLTGAFTACAGYFTYRETITVYHNGLYWKDGLTNYAFIPWAEVDAISQKQCGYYRVVIFDCGFSFRGILDEHGFYDYLRREFPEKIKEEDLWIGS